MERLINIFVLVVALALTSCGKDNVNAAEPIKNTTHRLRIVTGDRILSAVLYDNPTTTDFIFRLPFSVDLSDYGGAEKIFTPSPGLITDGSPVGLRPVAGDITLFAPWGNIAIFYKNGTSSGSLIPIGRIEEGVSALAASGTIRNVRFELVKIGP